MPGPLAAKVRAKFPGAYDDLDDATLERQVLAKYPEYADLAQEAPPAAAAPAKPRYSGGIEGSSWEQPGQSGRISGTPPEGSPSLMNALGQAAVMEAGGQAIGWGARALAPYTGRLLTALKAGGVAGVKAGAERIPIVGPATKAAVKAGAQSWAETAPQAVAAPAADAAAPVADALPATMGRIKLSAPELAAKMRDEWGSAKAGQMLYGPALKSADRAAAIKRLAPGESQLPGVAKRAIADKYTEFQQYLASAPNQRARDYILSLMKGPQ